MTHSAQIQRMPVCIEYFWEGSAMLSWGGKRRRRCKNCGQSRRASYLRSSQIIPNWAVRLPSPELAGNSLSILMTAEKCSKPA
jgi:hypothetical protein